MAHPWHHALSSAKRWGGRPEDYLAIHHFFDDTKRCLGDLRHRALRHHAEGVFLAERVFGVTLTTSAGRVVPVRWVGEQHVKEDLNWVPTVKDWLVHLRLELWMGRAGKLAVSAEECLKGDATRDREKSTCQRASDGCEAAAIPARGSRAGEPGGGDDHRLPGRPRVVADPGGLAGGGAGPGGDGGPAPVD
jgi:hypothetical protein